MHSQTLQSDMTFLIVIIFALALGMIPIMGTVIVPELESTEKSQSVDSSSANVLDVEYDRGIFSVGSTTFKDRKGFASQLHELAYGYQSIRFLASGNTTWDEILPILRDIKNVNLPIQCVHRKIRKEDS